MKIQVEITFDEVAIQTRAQATADAQIAETLSVGDHGYRRGLAYSAIQGIVSEQMKAILANAEYRAWLTARIQEKIEAASEAIAEKIAQARAAKIAKGAP